MKTSITASSYFPIYGEERGLARIKDDGYDAIDYGMADYRHFVYMMDDAETLAWAEGFRKLLDKTGLFVCQLHGPWRFPPMDSTEGARAETFACAKRAILVASALGCPYMVIHPLMPFGPREDLDPQYTHDLNVAFFKKLLPYAEAQNVIICMENIPFKALSLNSVQSVKEFIDCIDSPYLKACLDTGHSNITGEKPADSVRLLGARLRCMHVHDNHGVRDEHLPPGEGLIDWEAFASALTETGYQGILSLETGVVGDLSPEERIQKEQELYRRVQWHTF